MKTRRFNAQLVWAVIIAMLAAIFGIASAEESSILQEATMSGNEILTYSWAPALPNNSLFAGSYKMATFTDTTDSNSGKKELVIDGPSAI